MPDSSQTIFFTKAKHSTLETKTLRERTERPVVDHDNLSHEETMVNEVNMDFRIPGLHTFCCEACAEYKRSRKQMSRDVGNIELCELLETEPKTQCKVCLSYWNIGIVCCICGHFLRKGREENQQIIKYTMDLLSLPEYVIKKGRPHGHRYGRNPGDNITSPTSSGRSARRSSSRASMTDSYEMNNSAIE